MSVLNRILAGAVLGTATVVVAACSTGGSGADTPAAPDSAVMSTPTFAPVSGAAASTRASTHKTGSHGGSGGHASSSSASMTTTGGSASASGASPLPRIDSFNESVVSSDCSTSGGATTGTVSVKLTWTSSYATSAWIGGSQVAFAFNPKNAGGSTGPLPANGSLSVSFACDNDYYYYDLGVYNATGPTIEVEQVKNPS